MKQLWAQHWNDLSDAILYMQRRIYGMLDLVISEERIKSLALHEIHMLLRRNGKSLNNFPDLPQLDHDLVQQCHNRLLYEEFLYDRVALTNESLQHVKMLNEKQMVYEKVTSSVEKNGQLFLSMDMEARAKHFCGKQS